MLYHFNPGALIMNRLFPCRYSKRQKIFTGRQGTGCIRGEGAGRIICLVEVQNNISVAADSPCTQETATTVSIKRIGVVSKNNKKVTLWYCLSGISLRISPSYSNSSMPGAFSYIDLSKNIRHPIISSSSDSINLASIIQS
jgi:hypothetical protein